MKKYFLLAFFALISLCLSAQEKEIKITDVQKGNRLLLYAVNENEQAFDVLVTVKGTGFRQPKGKARLVHVPATSKVNVKNLIIERGKTPRYTYTLAATDSLSKRALKKPFEIIKIAPKKTIIVYLTEGCTSCDSLIAELDANIYTYKTFILKNQPKTKEYLQKAFEKSLTPLETITNPIVNIAGKYYPDIDTYAALIAIVNAD